MDTSPPGTPGDGPGPDHGPPRRAAGAEGAPATDGAYEGDGKEAAGGVDERDGGPDPLRFRQWMYGSAVGAVALGAARGLQEALTVERRRPAFVIHVDGDGEDDGPIRLELDPDDPSRSVALIRRSAGPPTAPDPGGA